MWGEPVPGHVLKRERGTYQVETAVESHKSKDQNDDGDKSHEEFFKLCTKFSGKVSNEEEDRAGSERESEHQRGTHEGAACAEGGCHHGLGHAAWNEDSE